MKSTNIAFILFSLVVPTVSANELPRRLDANTVWESVASHPDNRIEYAYTINLQGTEMASATGAELHDQLHSSVFANCASPILSNRSNYRLTFRYDIPEREDVKVFELTPSACRDYRSNR